MRAALVDYVMRSKENCNEGEPSNQTRETFCGVNDLTNQTKCKGCKDVEEKCLLWDLRENQAHRMRHLERGPVGTRSSKC